MPIIKETKYICIKCWKTFTYPELIKEKTITINKKISKYAHHCPICRNNDFRLVSTITEN